MPHDILIAFDGSDCALAALAAAETFAGVFGARLHVLSVIRPPDFGTESETEGLIEDARVNCEKSLADLKPEMEKAGLKAIFAVVVGHPAEQIVRYAETNDIDHIVVGHRGGGMFERWLIGSVARQVVAYARCSVTVVRQPKAVQARVVRSK